MGEHVMRRYVRTADLPSLEKGDQWPALYVYVDKGDKRFQPITIRFEWSDVKR